MNIRPARLDDARAIARIHVHTWQTAYVGLVPAEHLAGLSVDKHAAMWQARILGGTPQLLVAEEHHALLGWVAFGPSRDAGAGADVAEIWAIYVGAAHWGRRVGHRLWHGLRGPLRDQGFRSIGLWAFPENERAGRFYRALGFEVERVSARQFLLGGARLNEIRYVRSLEPVPGAPGRWPPGEA